MQTEVVCMIPGCNVKVFPVSFVLAECVEVFSHQIKGQVLLKKKLSKQPCHAAVRELNISDARLDHRSIENVHLIWFYCTTSRVSKWGRESFFFLLLFFFFFRNAISKLVLIDNVL